MAAKAAAVIEAVIEVVIAVAHSEYRARAVPEARSMCTASSASVRYLTPCRVNRDKRWISRVLSRDRNE
jgi:hypothetical protein